MEPAPNRNVLGARTLFDELTRWGLAHVCLSPGSRSAPLALAAHGDERISVTVHPDERSGAFYALGLARASGRPVALVCTSGTAGAHYLPAVIEADASRIPLVVLTADRPDRLLDAGAPQTMAQPQLFAPYVRFRQSVAPPEPTGAWLRWLRARVGRAMEAGATQVPGPVHFNLQFDEPLSEVHVPGDVPDDLEQTDPLAVLGRPDGAPFAGVLRGSTVLAGQDMTELRNRLFDAERPVVVAGPQAGRGALSIAVALGAPLLADPLSGLRCPGAPVVSGYDAFLRSPEVQRRLEPDLVVHVGRTPTCKHVGAWLAMHLGVDRIVVDPFPDREDPDHLGSLFVRAEPEAFAGRLGMRRELPPRPWLFAWLDAEVEVRGARNRALVDAPFGFEASLIAQLERAWSPDGRLLVASSMPIRQLDAFWEGGPQEVLSNRGVNGIDGLVSTAFGTAEADPSRPVWALMGDLALLHDLGGLAAAQRGAPPIVLVVVNNGGGGIFRYLPLAQTTAAEAGGAFEPLFLTPHDTRFGDAAALFGLEHVRPTDKHSLRAALGPATDRSRLVEVLVDQEDSVQRHKAFWADVESRVLALLEGSDW
ncbi:MAG: 2-succinyl-5-enolpyruvyl-6-hydroxy-3-cyclohexene-1-carboxylic-acid synthase [Deltaproteobacteria bacterium]|nr:2-succinyl-5-enolpyruvyl-6-hydroxy-3-cyclohexene-1-carboxylic-acid synthase [Deltaproteobacteria bacterium]